MDKIPRPKLEFIGDGTAHMIEDFEWDGGCCPKDFITDGLSVFKAGRFYASPFGPGLRAGLLHDADYFFLDKTRKEADDLFYNRLILLGYRRSKAYMMWVGVRIGGWRTWAKHAKGKAARELEEPKETENGL